MTESDRKSSTEAEPERIVKTGPAELYGTKRDQPLLYHAPFADACAELKRAIVRELMPVVAWLHRILGRNP